MKHVAVAGLLALGLIVNSSAQDVWSFQNPKPTILNLSAMHFPVSNSTTGWAVGVNGTILKTGNGGVSWTAYSGIDPSVNIDGVWFNSLFTGWAVGTGGTIFKTTNNGTAWTGQTSGVTHDLKGVHFLNGNNGWVVGNNGAHSVVLSTTNGGTNWSSQTVSSTRFTGVRMVDDFTGYIVGQAGILYKTVDAGISWFPLTSGTSVDLRGLSFVTPDLGWVVGNSGTILKTTDGGTTWAPQTSGTARNLTSVQFASSTKGWASGDSSQVYKTTDGGTTWVQKQNGGPSLRALQAVGDTVWSVGYTGKVIRSIDGGNNWTALSSGVAQTVNAVHFATAATGVAVGINGTILRSTDFGSNWTATTSGTANMLNAVHFADSVTGYAVGASGTLLKTTDAGQSWSPLTSGTANTLSAVYFTSALRGWIAGSGPILRATTDGGATWTTRNTGATQAFTSIGFATDAIGWAVGNNGLRRTNDSGLTWTTQGTGFSGIQGIHVLDTNNVLVLRTTGLYRTTNGGANWLTPAGTGTNFKAIRFQTPAKGYVVTANGAILYTIDSGATYTTQQVLPTGFALNSVIIAPGGRTFASGIDGAILKIKPPVPSGFYYPGSPYVFAPGTPITPSLPLYSGIVSSFTVASLPAGIKLDSLTGAISGTPTATQAATSYSISAGNESGASSASVSIAVRNPIITFSYPQRQLSLVRNALMTSAVPTISGTDPYGPYTCSVAPNLPSGLALDVSTCVVSGTPANAQAAANYVVTIKNGLNAFNRNDTLRIMVQAPPSNLVYATPQPSYTVGQAITPNTATISVVTGTTVRYSVGSALPAGLTLDSITGTLSGTPTVASPASDYVVSGTSSAGTATATLRITIVGPPTSLTYPALVFGLNVPDSARGAPVVSGVVTRWSITPLPPAGLVLDTLTGKFSGTATEAVSGSTHTVSAHNGYGSISASLSISVLNPIVLFSYTPKVFNLAPKVAMTSVSPIVAGTLPFTPVTYVISPALPAGLGFNANTGAISGTPDSGTSQAPKKYVVTARNGVTAFNKADTLTITISGYVVGIADPSADPTQHLRFAGRSLAFNAPAETRDLHVTVSDLRGRVLMERAVNWPAQSAIDLAQNNSAATGLLLIRIEYRDAQGRMLGGVNRRLAALP